MTFKPGENIKIELFTHYTKDNIHYDLLIKIKKWKLFEEFLENKIIPTIINTIKSK
jgi:hypothetical protein